MQVGIGLGLDQLVVNVDVLLGLVHDQEFWKDHDLDDLGNVDQLLSEDEVFMVGFQISRCASVAPS